MASSRQALHSLFQSRASIAHLKPLASQCCLRDRLQHSRFSSQSRRATSATQLRSQENPTTPSASSHTRSKAPLLLLVALVAATGYYVSLPDRRPTTLNPQTFVPYTIIEREVISPTSVLLTVAPRELDAEPLFLKPGSSLWRYPLWSVEFKQPEVQIARHYTPLPCLDDGDAQQLRFYVRAVAGGEMSTYVANRLLSGHSVFLRGPHPSFDLLARLPQSRAPRLVFLAGGTGLVPGMQAARAVLDSRPDASVSILWAVRHCSEVHKTADAWPRASLFSRMLSWLRYYTSIKTASPIELSQDMPDPSPIARQLLHLKARYGSRLDIRLAVDDQGSSFGDLDLHSAIFTNASNPSLALHPTAKCCPLHDQHMHESASDLAVPAATQASTHSSVANAPESCPCSSDSGKNLFVVSGPEGFIAHYAGPKIWRHGVLTQGAIGGVAAELQRRHPSLASDWLVLKL
ncbi:hypothetical protein CDD82_1349 [Ophiocordyceps australis]|uniref:FAD-binding FR-type domain-containing protein n=1 Tax=Ophiocordyceps australis TaxID=1399860 RepID=A0A2C5ZN06_9HYPO|nr:hypothetical protein CDD82_1349 [Ophiocordyceps australis]